MAWDLHSEEAGNLPLGLLTEMIQDSGDSGQGLALSSNRPKHPFVQTEEEWQELLVLPGLERGSPAQKCGCVGSVFKNES